MENMLCNIPCSMPRRQARNASSPDIPYSSRRVRNIPYRDECEIMRRSKWSEGSEKGANIPKEGFLFSRYLRNRPQRSFVWLWSDFLGLTCTTFFFFFFLWLGAVVSSMATASSSYNARLDNGTKNPIPLLSFPSLSEGAAYSLKAYTIIKS